MEIDYSLLAALVWIFHISLFWELQNSLSHSGHISFWKFKFSFTFGIIHLVFVLLITFWKYIVLEIQDGVLDLRMSRYICQNLYTNLGRNKSTLTPGESKPIPPWWLCVAVPGVYCSTFSHNTHIIPINEQLTCIPRMKEIQPLILSY